jgi:hypothetical protein
MNTDPADTHSAHLDLGDLIAQVTGQPVADQAREHLASCAHCQLEANRWNLVADGIRGLTADAPETPQPARPRHIRWRALPRPVRHGLLAAGSVAAAAVLFVAIGSAAGVVQVQFGGGTQAISGGTESTLTAVTGCPQLEQANGTLERVNGNGVVVKTASGQLVTVTTTAATKIGASGALLSDITDGATVTVAGTSSGGAVAADLILAGYKSFMNIPGITVVQGTVSDVGTAGFTVVTSAGTRVPVTATGSTDVVVVDASLGMLRVGGQTLVVGHAGPDGTLSALGLVQPPDWPAGAHGEAHIGVSSCSHTSINHEIMALASGG